MVRTAKKRSRFAHGAFTPICQRWLALLAALLALTAGAAWGENRTTVEMTLLTSLSSMEGGEWSLSGTGEGTVSFESKGNKNVKAQLKLSALVGDSAVLDITRAYVKTRFPGFRMTFGKAPLSWGEGFAFNAGDVIFKDFNPAANLRAAEIRDNTAWYTSLYIPLGLFSFFEGLFLPPPINIGALLLDPAAEPPSIEEIGGGGRVYFKAGGIKIEPGYLFRGEKSTLGTHNPYLSFQWNLLVDWHLSGSLSIPGNSPSGTDIAEGLDISFGLFHLQPLAGEASISFRLEGFLQPGQSWEETDSNSEEYGILLYPEVAFSPISSLSLSLRSVFSPVDLSAIIMTGVDWNVHQGFHILAYATQQIGELTDRFGIARDGGIQFSAGCRFIY